MESVAFWLGKALAGIGSFGYLFDDFSRFCRSFRLKIDFVWGVCYSPSHGTSQMSGKIHYKFAWDFKVDS